MQLLLIGSLFSSFTSLIFGAWILFKAPRKALSRTWFAVNLSVALWTFGIAMIILAPNWHEAVFWSKFRYVGLFFMPLTLLHFVLIFTRQIEAHKQKLYFLYTLGSVLLGFIFFSKAIVAGLVLHPTLKYTIVKGPIYFTNPAFLVVVGGLSFYFLLRAYFASMGIRRNQLRYVFIGLVLAYLFSGTMFLSIYEITTIPFGIIVLPIYQFVFLYAILVTRLLDVELVLRKSLIYSSVTALIMVGYVGLLFVFNRVFNDLGWNSMVLIVAMAFVIAITFDSLNKRIQYLIEHRIFRSRYTYQQAIKDATEIILRVIDIDKLTQVITRLVSRRMNLTEAALFLYDEEKEMYYVKSADRHAKKLASISIQNENILVEWFSVKGKILVREELQMQLEHKSMTKIERQNIQQLLQQLEQLDADVCIPVILRSKLLGFLVLGEKRSGELFSRDELDLLFVLADHVGISIENSLILEKQKSLIKRASEMEARSEYAAIVEKINQELGETNKELKQTKEEIIKQEKLASITQLAVALNHEIGNPLTAVMANLQLILERAKHDNNLSLDLLQKSLGLADKESRRIRDILYNLQSITEPVVADLLPGVKMIDLPETFKKGAK